MVRKSGANRYEALIETIFARHYVGQTEFVFEREELEQVATELGIKLPRNLGDVIYSFRYRTMLPPRVTKTASEGMDYR
jgi:hypothetical protein